MATRMIDRNAHRWGATISAVVLLVAFAFGWRVVVPIMTVAMGIGPVFGLRYSPFGATYRLIKKTFNLQIPVAPEEEAPPRFAQVMGLLFLGAATIAMYGGSHAAGWTLALIVAGLQSVLGVTGICIGCEMYLYGKRLSAARG